MKNTPETPFIAVKRTLFRLFLCGIFVGTVVPALAQAERSTPVTAATDSSRFTRMQQQLEGCWRTDNYQFRYAQENNTGYEYKSRVHSSAPLFILGFRNNEVYLDWVELTGGGSSQKIIRIRKNKLTVETDSGARFAYRKNEACTPLFGTPREE